MKGRVLLINSFSWNSDFYFMLKRVYFSIDVVEKYKFKKRDKINSARIHHDITLHNHSDYISFELNCVITRETGQQTHLCRSFPQKYVSRMRGLICEWDRKFHSSKVLQKVSPYIPEINQPLWQLNAFKCCDFHSLRQCVNF